MTGRKWTELFFLDEAVAMAAGHRPCGYCRRADYNRFAAAWGEVAGHRPGAKQMDQSLHRARINKGTRQQQQHGAAFTILPDGAMIWHASQAHLVLDNRLLPYTPTGYGPPCPRPASGMATVLTPAPMIAALRAGYTPALHPTAAL